MRTEKNNVIQVNLLINLQLNNVVPASDQTVAHLHCISEEVFFYFLGEERDVWRGKPLECFWNSDPEVMEGGRGELLPEPTRRTVPVSGGRNANMATGNSLSINVTS